MIEYFFENLKASVTQFSLYTEFYELKIYSLTAKGLVR